MNNKNLEKKIKKILSTNYKIKDVKEVMQWNGRW